MKRVAGLMALLILVLTVTPATADFYVIAGGGRLGTAITTVPVPITSPGLYYLTKNLTCSANANAITVHADDVTIDLNGFCITGSKESGVGNNGIAVAAGHTNVEIRNGSIKAFGKDGIQAGEDCTGIRVVGVRVRETVIGIDLPGSGNLVMDCTVIKGADNGILVGNSSLVKGCQVVSGGLVGISLLKGSTAMGNTVTGSFVGIGGEGSMVTDNTVSGNNWGIFCLSKCTITRNTAFNNNGAGISADTYCTITNNTTSGLKSDPTCTLADNTVTP